MFLGTLYFKKALYTYIYIPVVDEDDEGWAIVSFLPSPPSK